MKNKLKNNNIGIWGFGRVGKAAATFLYNHGYTISVLDTHFDASAQAWLQEKNIQYYLDSDKTSFLKNNDYILPSPGIDIRSYYNQYKNKWITELDVFQDFFGKPIIAVTGTVGKTTVTHLLSHILQKLDVSILTGGNIGTACFDLLDPAHPAVSVKALRRDWKWHSKSVVSRDKKNKYALLEVSSFQLEHCKTFAPNLAIWTNFAANHLDRHATEQDYFDAKYNIIAQQNKNQNALIPFDLLKKIKSKKTQSQLCFFATHKPDTFEPLELYDTLFYLDNNCIIKYQNNNKTSLLDINHLPSITFTQNWLIICAALYLLKQPLEQLATIAQDVSLPEHRLELVGSIPILSDNIYFFNDSKSTTPTSTLAAVEKLKNKSIILFLGGLSKGIDRIDLIKQLQHKIKNVYCFGAEANQLHILCIQYGIPSNHFATLDDAFNQCVQKLEPGDHVLFSPAGSSFDLFKNYEERGTYFKKLVGEYNDSKQKTNLS